MRVRLLQTHAERRPSPPPLAPGDDRFARLSRLLASASSPTADLYLGFSCADLLRAGILECHAPTVFRIGRTVIVMRHDSGLGRLPRHDRLIYLIDDNWRAGLTDRSVPTWYRMRMALLEARAGLRMERVADAIVTSSSRLAAIFRRLHPEIPVVRMDPAWPAARAELPEDDSRQRRLAYLGAATHQEDAHWLLQMVAPLLERHDDLSILWSGNHELPRALQDHPRLEIVPRMGWLAYRNWMRDQRFDIGLYPLKSHGFNRARSSNKLAEYDQFGAAVIGSAKWTSAREAQAAGACRLVPDDAMRWRYEIRALIETPGLAHSIARTNRLHQKLRGIQRQRRIWAGLVPEIPTHPLPLI